MIVTGDHACRETHNLLMPRTRGLRQQPGQVWQEAGTLAIVGLAAGNPLGFYLQSGRCLPCNASSGSFDGRPRHARRLDHIRFRGLQTLIAGIETEAQTSATCNPLELGLAQGLLATVVASSPALVAEL